MYDITQDYLKSQIKYDPETGIFTRLVFYRYTKYGNRADIPHHKGYRQVGLDGVTYVAHRLAWFYMTGKWPTNLIDHINGARDDNRWINLREATHAQNMYNKKASNKTGVKGVYKVKNGKYRVLIQLGTFDTIEEAQKSYNEAALKLHGEFAHSSTKKFF